MRLILIRHGRTASNANWLLDTAEPGADLDDVGRRQARDLVAALAPYPVGGVFASVLVRTQQTAAPLAQARGLPVEVLPGLREVGAGDDELSADARRYLGALLAWRDGDLARRIPGGEDGFDFLARYDAAIGEVAGRGLDCAAAFSHGAALRTWCARRVRGFAEAMGDSVFGNTAHLVADGDPDSGWDMVSLEGALPVQAYFPPSDQP
ncbi:MAG: histidine phosphatase family protein [Propionibacteriaceae bacterium]|jgi:probable phosphoglycerate mutase|nr:histidine phosphatase family protein [Propionibacteriaceae bacterium]